MAAKKRWVCPRCGNGKLLSSRPRKNATGRYCLGCSEVTGTLVERTCPALDKKREARAARTKERATRKRERARAKEMVGELHIPTYFSRVWRLAKKIEPVLVGWLEPEFILRRKRDGQASTGHCWPGRNRITITASDHLRDVQHVVIHEIAHIVAHARGVRWERGKRTNWHNDTFKAAERELQIEAGFRK